MTALRYSEAGAAQSRQMAYIKALAALGAEIHLVCTTAAPSAAVEYCDMLGLQCTCLGAEWATGRIGRRLRLLSAIPRAAHLIRNTRPDALVLLDTHPAVLVPLIRAGRKSGAVILHERTELPRAVAGRDWLSQVLLFAYERRCLPQMDGLYAITSTLLSSLLAVAGAGVCGRVVPAVADPARFDADVETSWGRSVMYAGGPSFAKDGLDILVRSFSRAWTALDGPADLWLDVYSPLDAASESQLCSIARECGLSGAQLRFHGSVDAGRIPGILKGATVLALARPDSQQARYGFPTKLAEYLLSGVPVVVTPVGDIPKYLSDGVTAYLAASEDVPHVAEALVRSLTDPGSHEVGAAGRALAMSRFSPMGAAAEILALIEECEARRACES